MVVIRFRLVFEVVFCGSWVVFVWALLEVRACIVFFISIFVCGGLGRFLRVGVCL